MIAKLLARFRHAAGLDGAVAFTVLSRICNITSSVGNVLLLVHFLSPTEQGYYYTLLSLVLLQVVFELGFSFVIQQYAAHESVMCKLPNTGLISGEPRALARLASVLQITLRWYLRASISIAVVLLPLGFYFFTQRGQTSIHVAWRGPWVSVVIASAASFMIAPVYAFLDGCGQIRQVAKARFAEAAAVLSASWLSMLSGHGLYAPAAVNSAVVVVGVVFLFRRRGLLMVLLKFPTGMHAVSWRREIWPFQWKLAVSWLCTYFITQMFTPILFATQGPVAAGRMGMSINIVAYLPLLMLSWISTKATPFGQFIKLGKLDELDDLFFKTFRKSITMLILAVAACLCGIVVLYRWFPHFATRIEPPQVFLLLLATAICTFSVQSMAVYLRCFKSEPFMPQAITVFILTTIGVALSARKTGALGVAVSYFLSNGLLGVTIATLIFHARRKFYRLNHTGMEPGAESTTSPA